MTLKFSNRRRDANRINGMSEIESSIDKKLRSAFQIMTLKEKNLDLGFSKPTN